MIDPTVCEKFLSHHKTLRGIYFLWQDNELVYVGKSNNILSRIENHKSNKKFNFYSYIEFEVDNLLDIETEYIKKYKPKYNIQNNKPKRITRKYRAIVDSDDLSESISMMECLYKDYYSNSYSPLEYISLPVAKEYFGFLDDRKYKMLLSHFNDKELVEIKIKEKQAMYPLYKNKFLKKFEHEIQ